ncbi:beta-galactosidase 15 [Alnus glutinosa]|uniref:beta-galactosidase 15 n=1 Tax=Alnus glutinosa TaxID=3517 RepID=UPI002D768F44|nr:beta-galactosidase 15 [Alnus glutinosa]
MPTDRFVESSDEDVVCFANKLHPMDAFGFECTLDKVIEELKSYNDFSIHRYDFSGNLDLVRYIKTIQEEGLYAVLRIGPYVCAEWNYGGFPVWLHNIPGIKFRTKNDVFMNEMSNFMTVIVDMMKHENLFASQGGPIIISQVCEL